jgi:hypothetical protein
MLSNTDEAASAAAHVDPPAQRSGVFRMALIALGLGWLAVIALLAAGLTISGGHKAVVVAPPVHLPATGPGHQSTTAGDHSTVGQAMPIVPSVPDLAPGQIAETTREFARTPPPCSPASKCADRGCKKTDASAVTATFSSVQAAFDGDGLTLPADGVSGNFDCSGFSYQGRQLSADGFWPGDEVAVDGRVLTLPPIPPGAPDEIVARGQTVTLSSAGQSAAELGFLGAGEFGTQKGTVTITYAGGSQQTATLRFADWYSDIAVPGTVIAASGLWSVPPGQHFAPAPVSIYYEQIPLKAHQIAASVTLPDNPNMHLFDFGVAAPAAYPTVSYAYNDTGLVPSAAASYGNYDGAGHSYSANALAAKGLLPGAAVIAQGVRFMWPAYGRGHFDNIRTQGQTIGITGSGSTLGFLGAATLGTQRGTVTIQYAGGTTQTAVLTFADWRANHAASGSKILATVPWNQLPDSEPQLVSVYSTTVPLEKGKTVVSVTLPVNIDMHVFALGIGK